MSIRFLASLMVAVLLWYTFAVGLWAPILDVDVWWQLWAGEQTLAGKFPRANGLAWTAAGHPWVSHEPLVALLYGAVGLGGVGIVRALVVTACAVLVAQLGYRRDSAYASIAAIAWASQLIVFGITERALTFGNLMMAALMLVLFGGADAGAGAPAPGRWRLPAACLLAALWANVHGSFVVGVAAIAVVSWRWALVAAAATLLNPNGPRLWGLVAGYAAGSDAQRIVHESIFEWQPLWPNTLENGWRLLVLLAGVALVVRRGPWRRRLFLLLVTALALRHRRYTDIAALACLPFVARALEGARWVPPRPLLNPAWLSVPAFVLTYALSPSIAVHRASFPAELAQAIPRPSRLFNTFDIGGYLGYQGVPVFFDSRNDCYPPELLRQAFLLDGLRPGWEAVLDGWKIDVVVTRNQQLQQALLARGWTLKTAFPGDQHRKGLSVVVGPRDPPRVPQ